MPRVENQHALGADDRHDVAADDGVEAFLKESDDAKRDVDNVEIEGASGA